MKKYTNQPFWGLFDRGERLRLQELSFSACTFENCALSLTEDISRMAEIRDVELNGCEISNCIVGPLVASELRISDLATNDLLILWCPYFDRVVLRGKIGRIKINAAARPATVGNEKQQPFEDFRQKFYANVEWALDISEARFKWFDLEGVPAHLVRRDPESQVVVTRQRALQVATSGWEKKLDPSNKLWPFVINLFLTDGDPDIVLVAPLGAAKAEREPLLRGLQELRRIGLAEPD